MGMFLWFSTLHAQRIVPPLVDWTSFPSGPFSQGSINGMIMQGSGSLANGATTDSGFFLHRPAGEGDDFRACFAAVSSSGLTGVMVRDEATPDAAFVFVGSNGANETIVRYRHTAGAPAQTIAFGAVGASPWYRLVVGRDTVYAYTAGSASAATPTAWNFLTAIKVQLKGDKPSIRRNDLAGAFVSQGSATLADLYQTEHLIWTERTTKSDATLPGGVWESVTPSVSQHAVSPMVRRHVGTGSAAHLDFPIQVKAEGTYHFFLHLPAGNPQTVSAMLVGQPTPVTRDNQPEGRNSWIYVGTSTLAANGTATVRLMHPGTAGLAMFGDAARAFRAAKAESPVSGYPGWTKTPALTDRITLPGSGATNEVRRTQYAQNGSWNAGAHSSNVLVGDGKLRFRFIGDGFRMQAGLTTTPTSNNPADIPYRFNNKGNGKVQAVGAASEFNYVNGDWMEIERIGRQIVFRRNSLFQHAVSLPEEAPAFYYVDASLLDENARLYGTHVFGQWSPVAGVAGLIPNATVRAVIDADSEDGLQSIFDVDLGADLDEDGLTNEEEVANGTLPENPDTDGDGLLDGHEVNLHGTSPTLWDTDGDGLSDGMEVNSPLGFNPLQWSTLLNGVSNGVSDRVRWDIMHADPANYPNLASVLPNGDYDLDGVINIHEGEDGTSAIDIDDYFQEVAFDRLFGSHVGSSASIDINNGVESSRLVRAAAVPDPAAGISHHEARDGTRVRFQFLPLVTTSGTADQVIVGFAHRGHPPYGAIPEANYAVAIRRETSGKARLLFYGSEVVGAPVFDVSDSDLVELRLATGPDGAAPRTLQVEVNQSAVFPDPITLPAGAGGFDSFTWDHDKKESTPEVPAPLALVVHLPGDGAGVHNLRYRRVHDPDRDNDQMADAWEQQIVDHVEGYTEVGQVLAGGDADQDGLLNLEEYEHGTDPTEPDTDGDGMIDGWEIDHGLDPKNPADGSEALGADGKPVADQDGDGLSNIEEYRYGSRPDRVSTMNEGFSDFWKHRWGLDPLVALAAGEDPDDDGLTNEQEHSYGTDPNEEDTDGDGFEDGWEIENGFDPHHDDRNTDSDNDGLLNTDELAEGTDPLNPDSDGDDLEDGEEVHELQTDPLDPDTDGDGLPDGWEVAGLVMHFGYQSHPGEPIVRDRTYGPWELMSVEEGEPVGGDTPVVQTWERNVYQYDWYYNSTFTLRDAPLVRHLTRLADGTIVEPEDGWVHDTTTNTLIRPHQVTKWTVEYDAALRLWVGVHQTPQQISTWWWVFTNPLSDDTDEDGLPDGWEYQHWLNPDRAADAGENPDHDGLINSGEFTQGTHPWREDTDGDALTDGHEVSVTLTDPLDPLDPGSQGGATPPVSPVLKPANRVEILVVQPAPTPVTGVAKRPAPTISGRGGRPPGGPGTTPPPPPAPHPIPGPLPTQPGTTAPNPLAPPPAEELYVEFRTQHKLVVGSDQDTCGGTQGGGEGGTWEWDEEKGEYIWISSPDPLPPGDNKWKAMVSQRIGGSLDERISGDLDSADDARTELSKAEIKISHDTDWEKSSAEPLTSARVTASGKRMYSQELEVRLVRKTGPETYAPVNVEVRKKFLRVKRKRQLPAPPSPDEGWVVEKVDPIELVIPVGQSKSVEDNERPVDENVIGKPMGEMTMCWEYEVILLPVDLKEAWSDQIKDVEVNGMPDKTGNNNKDYIFMGARHDGKGHGKLRLGSALPEDIRDTVLWRFAKKGTETPEQGSSSYEQEGKVVRVTLDNPPNADDKDFVIVFGYDKNEDGNLSQSEVMGTPETMHDPPGGGVNPTSMPFTFKIVGQARYDEALDELLNSSQSSAIRGAVPNAADLLQSFCEKKTPANATAEATTVERSETGL